MPVETDWHKALGQSIGLERAERTLAKARRNFMAARIIAWVNPTMRTCVEETRKSLEFWTLMVADMRRA
jgi:hypothetical protein